MSDVVQTFDYTGSIIEIALDPGFYKIECYGAQGQSANGTNVPSGSTADGCGGFGAYLSAIFKFRSQVTLRLAAGQCPAPMPAHTTNKCCGGGGGGMSAVAIKGSSSPTNDVPLIVAGGGGGGTEIYDGGARGGPGLDTTRTQGNSGGGWTTRGTTYAGNSWITGLGSVPGYTVTGYPNRGGFGGGGGGTSGSGAGGGGYQGASYAKGSNGGGSYVAELYEVSNIIKTAGANTGNGKVIITSLRVPPYTTSGSAILGPYPIPDTLELLVANLSWTEYVPEACTLELYTAIAGKDSQPGDSDFVKMPEPGQIPSLQIGHIYLSCNLWLKILMTTTDTLKTPELDLNSLCLTIQDNPGPKFLELTFDDANSLRNARELTVVYNSNTGVLSGETSKVSDFSYTFIPGNLAPVDNPNDAERVYVTLFGITTQFSELVYKTTAYNQHGQEFLSLGGTSVTGLKFDYQYYPDGGVEPPIQI